MRTSQKTLMGKYYSVCCAIILLSMVLVGSIFMVLANDYLREEKISLLEKNVTQAARLTMENYAAHEYRYVSSDTLQPVYAVLGSAIEADIYLSDNKGNILIMAHTTESAIPQSVPQAVLDSLSKTGSYQGSVVMAGTGEDPQYAVATPVVDENGLLVGAVMATARAANRALAGDMLQMFLIAAIVVLVVSFIVIYFVTTSLVNPLRQMAAATRAFAKGDFSVRVPVEGDDEIGRLASAFNNMATELALTESVRRSFTANVSHELKTPMTTIGGFVDGILDGTIPPERQNHYLRIVSSEVQRLSRLVRNMLTLSQIEAGERTIQPTEVEITSLVTNTLLGFEQRLEEKHIEVEGLDTDRYWVLADADLIQQVVYNLIDNAVKFVNEGGKLSFDFYTEGENIMVAVRNTGSGVLPEEIPRLFDRFYKTDRSRSLDKNGVGLGLSICRTIMNVHEGEIFVRSQPGEYTEFVFGLKADPAHYKKGVNRKAPMVDASFTTLPAAPAAGREEKQHEKPQQ